MNRGRTLCAQLIEYASHKEFKKCVRTYPHRRSPGRFAFWDQFLAMSFPQLTYRENLRDIEACVGAVPDKLCDMGSGARSPEPHWLAVRQQPHPHLAQRVDRYGDK